MQIVLVCDAHTIFLSVAVVHSDALNRTFMGTIMPDSKGDAAGYFLGLVSAASYQKVL